MNRGLCCTSPVRQPAWLVRASTQTSEPKPAQKCRGCHFHCFTVSETDFMLHYLLTCCRCNLKYLCHWLCTPLHTHAAKEVIWLAVLRTPWLQQGSHLSSIQCIVYNILSNSLGNPFSLVGVNAWHCINLLLPLLFL